MAQFRPKRVLLALAWQNETLAMSLDRYAQRAGWHLDLQMYTSGEVPRQWRGEGIVTVLGRRQDLNRFIRNAGAPAVCLTLNEPEVPPPRVDFDGAAIGCLAAEHFLEKRFTECAWYSYSEQEVERARCDVFAQRLQEVGYHCRRLIWRRDQGKRHDTWANRQAWLSRRLAKLPKPLAVFCTDDMVAVEVIEACLRAGLIVPEQVAVLGVGNLELYREATPVALSSIVVDFERLAFAAANLLDRLMLGKKVPATPVLFPPQGIAIRRSTDTIAVASPEVALAIRFMLDHYPEPLSVHEIVAATTSSQTGLYSAFQAELGRSPMAVLRRIRLDKAKQMLRETDLKVHHVAEACGFGDVVNLYRRFGHDCALTPKAYRKRHRAPSS